MQVPVFYRGGALFTTSDTVVRFRGSARSRGDEWQQKATFILKKRRGQGRGGVRVHAVWSSRLVSPVFDERAGITNLKCFICVCFFWGGGEREKVRNDQIQRGHQNCFPSSSPSCPSIQLSSMREE